jgi:hypothetical protein
VVLPLEESLGMYGRTAAAMNYTRAASVVTTANLTSMYKVNRSVIDDELLLTDGARDFAAGQTVWRVFCWGGGI